MAIYQNNNGTYMNNSYLSVGKNKTGVARVWLQGANLSESGLVRGSRYYVTYDIEANEFRGKMLADGESAPENVKERIVSGKKLKNREIPIIDLASKELENTLGGAEKVRIDFFNGEFVGTIHHAITKIKKREQRLKSNLKEGFVDKGVLCVGGGVSVLASSYGFEMHGIKSNTRYIIDREEKYLEACRMNNPAYNAKNTHVITGSLEEVETSILPDVDVVCVSLPCTGHSLAGRAKNKLATAEEHKTDANAVFGLMRILDKNPSVIISENVREARNSATYLMIKNLLTIMGYTYYEIELDQKQSGAIEQRARYWLVAVSNGLPPIDVSKIPTYQKRYNNIGELIDNVPSDDSSWKDISSKVERTAKNKALGKGFAINLVDEQATSIGTCGKGYSKIRMSEPALLNKANPNESRILKAAELARAQGVPEQLINNISNTTATEILGQGIDFFQGVGVSELIAMEVFRQFTTKESQLAMAV